MTTGKHKPERNTRQTNSTTNQYLRNNVPTERYKFCKKANTTRNIYIDFKSRNWPHKQTDKNNQPDKQIDNHTDNYRQTSNRTYRKHDVIQILFFYKDLHVRAPRGFPNVCPALQACVLQLFYRDGHTNPCLHRGARA